MPRAAQLRALFLTGTPVTDIGLRDALLACSGLRCLCLEDCARVTPAGLSSLRCGAPAPRGQHLECLNLAAPGLAAADVCDVAAALPRLALLHVRCAIRFPLALGLREAPPCQLTPSAAATVSSTSSPAKSGAGSWWAPPGSTTKTLPRHVVVPQRQR